MKGDPQGRQGLAARVEKQADVPRPIDGVRRMNQVPTDPRGREYFIRYREKENRTLLFVVSLGADPEVVEDDIEHPVEPPKVKE